MSMLTDFKVVFVINRYFLDIVAESLSSLFFKKEIFENDTVLKIDFWFRWREKMSSHEKYKTFVQSKSDQ